MGIENLLTATIINTWASCSGSPIDGPGEDAWDEDETTPNSGDAGIDSHKVDDAQSYTDKFIGQEASIDICPVDGSFAEETQVTGIETKEPETAILPDKEFPFLTLSFVNIAPADDPSCKPEDHHEFYTILAIQSKISAEIFITPESDQLTFNNVIDDQSNSYQWTFNLTSSDPPYWTIEGLPEGYSYNEFFCYYDYDNEGYEFILCSLDILYNDCVVTYQNTKEAGVKE